MDAFENENFSESIFKNLNPKFWYKRESWKYAYVLPGGYKLDAWHISKSLMVVCIILFAVFYAIHGEPYARFYINDFIFAGFIWNATFRLFYHWIFRVQ
jgi:hypothetical protein